MLYTCSYSWQLRCNLLEGLSGNDMALVTHHQILPALGRAKSSGDTKETELKTSGSGGLSVKWTGLNHTIMAGQSVSR